MARRRTDANVPDLLLWKNDQGEKGEPVWSSGFKGGERRGDQLK